MKAVVSKQASEAMSELSDSDLATLENLNKNVAASSTLNDVIKRAGLSRILKRTPEGRQIYLSRQGGLNLLYSITEDEQRKPVLVLLDINATSPPRRDGKSALSQAASEALSLVSGAPIESPEQDTLDRGRLAQALATSLRGYGSAQNLVVGLYGPWGSGKTSLLNMAAGAIAEPKDGSEPIITRFNPWNFTDQDQLTSEFFDALSNAIDRPDLGSQYTEASTLIQKFGRRLQPLSAIPHLGTLIDVALRGSEVVSLGLQREGDKLRDLEVAKADISKALLDLERRTIVIIDDIDRLTNEEIRRLFQLVKSTADFSNVIYLLAFDKAIVTKALSGVQGGDDTTYGESYLEKIVNVPIDIPKISSTQIQRLLIDRLNAFAARHPDYLWKSNPRIYNVIEFLQTCFHTIRSLDRFINLLTFSEPIVSGCVDYSDLIGIIGLQTAIPGLYYFIRDNPDLFVSTLAGFYVDRQKHMSDVRGSVDKAIEEFRGGIAADDIRNFLSHLFPKLESVYKRVEHSNDEMSRWHLERRVGSSLSAFQGYFQLNEPADEVSPRRFFEILKALDREELYASVNSLIEERRAISFLEELKRYADDAEVQAHLADILYVLFDVSDKFPEDLRGFPFRLDGHTLIMQIVYQFLRRVDNETRRFELLLDAINESSASLYSLVTQVSVEDQTHGRYDLGGSADATLRLVSGEHLDVLEGAALDKIKLWADDGRLAAHPNIAYFLFRWKNWGDPNDVRDYILAKLDSENFIRLVVLMTLNSEHNVFRESPTLEKSSLDKLVPLDDLRKRLSIIEGPGGSHIPEHLLESLQRIGDRR